MLENFLNSKKIKKGNNSTSENNQSSRDKRKEAFSKKAQPFCDGSKSFSFEFGKLYKEKVINFLLRFFGGKFNYNQVY